MPHTVDSPKHDEYIDPNHLMGRGGVTFIYTVNGNLYTQESRVSHKEMLQDEELWKDLLSHPIGVYDKNLVAIPSAGFKRRAFAESYSVLGRTGMMNGRDIASFWGSQKDFLSSYIDKCASKLLHGGFVKRNTEVYSLVFEKTTIEKILNKDLVDQEKNKKEYNINGTVYTWEYLRDLRTKTHTDPDKENLVFLCSLLSPNIVQKHPELRALVPTRCDGNIHFKQGTLQNYLSAGKAPGWGPVYPTIGDSTLNFKHWLLKENQ